MPLVLIEGCNTEGKKRSIVFNACPCDVFINRYGYFEISRRPFGTSIGIGCSNTDKEPVHIIIAFPKNNVSVSLDAEGKLRAVNKFTRKQMRKVVRNRVCSFIEDHENDVSYLLSNRNGGQSDDDYWSNLREMIKDNKSIIKSLRPNDLKFVVTCIDKLSDNKLVVSGNEVNGLYFTKDGAVVLNTYDG